ncbi:MAG: DUF3179 domain-containing protein [Moorea sp. SIO3G5]|nr:DUF3179 domain-containing protein [Moorena sp. SIO3G5]
MKIPDITCGSDAASHLEPYLPQISQNFELPRHIASLIASWDCPEFVGAKEANHMRNDDYVVGLVYKGVARAYPLWITDYYHIINDKIAGEPLLFATCERCQSGSAFLSTLEAKPTKFAGCGMYNASLTMMNRGGLLDRNKTIWLHYEGVALHGPLAGNFLPQIPTFHTTWQDWKLAHPNTDVMAVPKDKNHRDARHGHAREEYFARPGIEPAFVKTITGDLDDRYPENEMVLGINVDQGVKAYPLREVKLSGGVVEDELGEHPIVIFAGPRPEQFTMAAYSRVVEGQILSFHLCGNYFIDRETHTYWNIEGLAVKGPLAQKQLTPLRWQFVRWHAWFYPHRSTELYLHQHKLPVYPEIPSNLDISPFLTVLEGLGQLSREIVIEAAIINLSLPHETEQGLSLQVGQDKLNLYRFKNAAAAEDYVALGGAWSCQPIDAKLGRKFSCCSGLFVLESDPEIQYADPCQIVRLPDGQIQWSDLVTDPDKIKFWSADIPELEESPKENFNGLFEYLRRSGFDVIEVAFLPHSQLRVGTESAVAATIKGDRFAIYKCEHAAAATNVLSDFPHAFQVERWIFRSIPVLMYRDTYYEIGQLPKQEIYWSKLVGNKQFISRIESDFNKYQE